MMSVCKALSPGGSTILDFGSDELLVNGGDSFFVLSKITDCDSPKDLSWCAFVPVVIGDAKDF